MKAILLLIGLTILLTFAGCDGDKVSTQLIDKAEAVLETNPDSAYLLLDSIRLPEELSERQLARWCMLSGKAADKIFAEMPYVSQLEGAQAWFQKHGTPEEQAQIGLFMGRSYVEDKEYEKAMNTYKQAFDLAIGAEAYNQAGYICSYMADLYVFEELFQLATDKYKEAASYFQQAKNRRSHAFALRDIGRMYAFMDSCQIALTYLQEANTIVTSLGNSLALYSIYNGLGNVYGMLGQLELAEKYQLESIRLDSTDIAPNYLALAEVYREHGDYEKARLYVNKASIPSYNKYTLITIAYDSYLIEKADNNPDQAFMYLEKYILMADSVKNLQNKTNVLETEKRFDHFRILTDNMKLRSDKQRQVLLIISILTLCLFLLIAYQVGITRKNRRIYEQRKVLSEQDIRILSLSKELYERKEELNKQALSLETNKQLLRLQGSLEEQQIKYKQNQQEVEQLNDQLIQLRRDKLQASVIARKLQKLSAKVIPGMDKSLLSEKDWKTIISTVDDVYAPITDKLLQKDLNVTPTELRYCYLVFFELEANAEAILLNISTDSVNKNYQRLRQKLDIKGGKRELYAYLLDLI